MRLHVKNEVRKDAPDHLFSHTESENTFWLVPCEAVSTMQTQDGWTLTHNLSKAVISNPLTQAERMSMTAEEPTTQGQILYSEIFGTSCMPAILGLITAAVRRNASA